jgi:para-nitrobenzyl esterase
VVYTKLSLLTALAAASVFSKPVKVDSGLLEGHPGTHPDVMVFKGIPYAAPPVGDMRWKSPEPAAPWQGVKDAAAFGPSCMQTSYPEGSLYHNTLGPISEDCLTLNVWTTAKQGEKHPVMVWIHGGALTRGSGATAWYDGEALSRKGVVIVTINYRLGVFGFFTHPELTAESSHHTSGNYGLLDQVAALQWVKRNIAAFGGDPKKVTIFGESAGSWSTNFMMASPLTRGLIDRVIGESGAFFGVMKKLADTEKVGVNAGDLKTLRAKPAEELMKTTFDQRAMGPVVDGYLLPTDIYTVFKEGKQNDVPLLAGYNADEGTAFANWNGNVDAFVKQGQQRFGKFSDEYFAAYPAGSEADAKASFYATFRDTTFGWNMRTWGRMNEQTGHHPAYLYYFSHVQPGPTAERYGAYHASEILYVFDNLDVLPRPFTDVDRKLSEEMASYWVNFAKTGDPNGPGLPKWPAYHAKDEVWMEFGPSEPKTKVELNKAKLDFMDKWFADQRAKQQ